MYKKSEMISFKEELEDAKYFLHIYKHWLKFCENKDESFFFLAIKET